MRIQDNIEGKKAWRAHVARVKLLPQDYQIVYKEIQELTPTSIKNPLTKKPTRLRYK